MEANRPKRRRRGKLANWIFFGVLIIAVGAISWYSYSKSQKETKWKLQDFQSTESVYTGDLQVSVLASATLKAYEVVQVRPEASGKIEELMFDVGDWVNEGDPLVRLDQRDLKTRVETTKSNLKQMEANLAQVKRGYLPSQEQSLRSAVDSAELSLKKAKDDMARTKELHSKGFASDVELENASHVVDLATQVRDQAKEALDVLLKGSTSDQIKGAEAAVETARLAVKEADNALGDSIIYSPMSGVVLERQVSLGSVIVSNLAGFGGGDIICSIGDLSRMKAIASVDENDVGSVQEGQKCTLKVDAYPDEKFEGIVLKIHPQATIEGGVTAFVTEVEVPNPDRRLMAGMTCEVEIITKIITNILLVPDQAIVQKNEKNYVFVVDQNKKIEAREIQIGETNFESTQVLSGLSDGEQVITRGVPSDLLDQVVKDKGKDKGKEESGSRGKVVVRTD